MIQIAICFILKLTMQCPSFEEQVYRAAENIPRGKLSTYGDISIQIIGNKSYARHVGRALAENPHTTKNNTGRVVPCHRVVTANGVISGYFGDNSPDAIAHRVSILEAEGIIFTKSGSNIKVKNLVSYL